MSFQSPLLFFSLLEDSGYFPRLALLVDRVFKRLGLSGRAVIPIVLGFACDTMATMVTRTLETKRERVLATLLLAMHLLLVQRLGMSTPPSVERAIEQGKEQRRSMPFFPNFLLRDIIGWYAALGVLGALAAIFPWELGTKANPFGSAPAGIRPEWYFLFMFQTFKYLPAKVLFIDSELLGLAVFSLAGAVWVIVPFLDYKAGFGKVTRFFTGLGIFALGYIVLMSALALWT